MEKEQGKGTELGDRGLDSGLRSVSFKAWSWNTLLTFSGPHIPHSLNGESKVSLSGLLEV